MGTVVGTVWALCGHCAGTVTSNFAATSAPSGSDVAWKPGADKAAYLAAGFPFLVVSDEIDKRITKKTP